MGSFVKLLTREELYFFVARKSKSKFNCIQWNLVIKMSDITKPSYNKVILLVPALYISLFFYPDNDEKPDITR